ncbi:MAG: Smr/MutS family protein [Candidatus Uhrbacteria bacterium]|nr:Smr/MutS family protein [Candidatus Uhrbacteria bacterium]
MPKLWKHARKGSTTIDTPASIAESKIFGAELSGNAPIIDLHGLLTEAGVHDLDLFMHSAFMRGDDVIKVIHGRGTGKMREAVHAFLSTQALVEMFRDSHNTTEMSGVTYVVLKKRE